MGAENYAGLVNFGAFSLSETNPDRAVNQRKGSRLTGAKCQIWKVRARAPPRRPRS
jgi:hypothetical protein